MPKTTRRSKKGGNKTNQSPTPPAPKQPRFTADQTNKILTAILDADPWNQAHGKKEQAWDDAVSWLNDSGFFTSRIKKTTVRDKIRVCVKMHEGDKPEQTVFSDSEGFLFDLLIDRVRGQIQASKEAKDNCKQEKSDRDNRLDREGYVARSAALTTFARTRNQQVSPPKNPPLSVQEAEQAPDTPLNHYEPTPDHETTPAKQTEDHTDAQRGATGDIKLVTLALQHINTVQGQRFECFLTTLTEQHAVVSELAKSTVMLARAQTESNQLLRCALVEAGIDIPPFDTSPQPSAELPKLD